MERSTPASDGRSVSSRTRSRNSVTATNTQDSVSFPEHVSRRYSIAELRGLPVIGPDDDNLQSRLSHDGDHAWIEHPVVGTLETRVAYLNRVLHLVHEHLRHAPHELTIVSIGSGRKLLEHLIDAKVAPEFRKKIRWRLIDPIYEPLYLKVRKMISRSMSAFKHAVPTSKFYTTEQEYLQRTTAQEDRAKTPTLILSCDRPTPLSGEIPQEMTMDGAFCAEPAAANTVYLVSYPASEAGAKMHKRMMREWILNDETPYVDGVKFAINDAGKVEISTVSNEVNDTLKRRAEIMLKLQPIQPRTMVELVDLVEQMAVRETNHGWPAQALAASEYEVSLANLKKHFEQSPHPVSFANLQSNANGYHTWN